jgi:hypothetical protein
MGLDEKSCAECGVSGDTEDRHREETAGNNTRKEKKKEWKAKAAARGKALNKNQWLIKGSKCTLPNR